jgi:hypothetical protein
MQDALVNHTEVLRPPFSSVQRTSRGKFSSYRDFGDDRLLLYTENKGSKATAHRDHVQQGREELYRSKCLATYVHSKFLCACLPTCRSSGYHHPPWIINVPSPLEWRVYAT